MYLFFSGENPAVLCTIKKKINSELGEIWKEAALV
jgi:hypothetical protein